MQVEPLESRRLLSATVPGVLSLSQPDLTPSARIGSNNLSKGAFLGWTVAGEAVRYLVESSEASLYSVQISAATMASGVAVHLEVDGTDVTGTIPLPRTQNWYDWRTTSTAAPLELIAGQHVITLVIEHGTANFQAAVFSKVQFAGSNAAAESPAGPVLPGSAGTGITLPPAPGKWWVGLAEEFDGSSLSNLWTPHQYWARGATVGEGLEESDPANVSQSDGVLTLRARADNAFGPAYTGALVQAGGIQGVASQPTYSFLYGYAEARIRIPAGAGLWPAFWMLPASHNDNNGEIDVMETYDADTTSVFGTVHRFGKQEQHPDSTGIDLSAGFHTFAVDWEPDHITWYLDGVPYGTTTDTSLIPTEPMFPILDLAVGPPGTRPAAGELPASMAVDYVRIWQKQ